MEKNDFKLFARGSGVSNNLLESKLLTVPTNMSPYVLEERKLNVAQMDVFSRLMMDRIIFWVLKLMIMWQILSKHNYCS